MFNLILVLLFVLMAVLLIMTFVRIANFEEDAFIYFIGFIGLVIVTFVFIVFSAYNTKHNLYFTDVNGKSYVYKKATHVSNGRNNLISFTDKNGNDMQFNISSLKMTDAK